MNSIVTLIHEAIDSECTKSSDLINGDCSVVIDVHPEQSITVDLDHSKSPIDINSTRCDFLYLAEVSDVGYVIPLEFSTHPEKNFDTALKQLQAGASFVQENISTTRNLCFCPSLVTKKLSKYQWNLLRRSKKKVSLHRCRQPIRRFSCGIRMSKILEAAEKHHRCA